MFTSEPKNYFNHCGTYPEQFFDVMCKTCPLLRVTNLVHHTASQAILFSSFSSKNFENTSCSSEETFVGGWWDRRFISLGFGDQHFDYERANGQFFGPVRDGGLVRLPTGIPGFLLSAYPKSSHPRPAPQQLHGGVLKCSGPW